MTQQKEKLNTEQSDEREINYVNCDNKPVSGHENGFNGIFEFEDGTVGVFKDGQLVVRVKGDNLIFFES